MTVMFDRVQVSFVQNPKFISNNDKYDADRNMGVRIGNEITDFSDSNLGEYRHSAFLQSLPEFLKVTGLVVHKSLNGFSSYFKSIVTWNGFWHAVTVVRPAWRALPDTFSSTDAFLATVKKVTDAVGSWLFVIVSFVAVSPLADGTNPIVLGAKLIMGSGDAAELPGEVKKLNLIGVAVEDSERSGNTNKMHTAGSSNDMLKQAYFHQMLVVAKVAASVAAATLLVMQWTPAAIAYVFPKVVPVLAAYVPSVVGAVFATETLAVINAGFSLMGATAAMVAHYYKQLGMMQHPTKFAPLRPHGT